MGKIIRRLSIILVAVLQVVLCASPFIPFVKQNIWSPQDSVSNFSAMLAAYIGIEFACLAGLVYLLLQDFKDQAHEDLDRFEGLLHRYTPLNVRQLRENEFYKEFLGYCTKASHYANICYLSPRPPAVGGSKERKKYYSEIASVMRNNPETRFRRIVRDSIENRTWVTDLARGLQGTTNCAIGLLDDYGPEAEMPRALSVQIVDGEIAWLVAIGEHGGAEVYRDIAIENAAVTRMLNKYFERLWEQSIIVFEPARQNTEQIIAELRGDDGEDR